jgi:hypothetical protein
MQLLWITFGAETVSISILTEGDAGGFSYNIVTTALFTCLRMRLCIFYCFNNLINNKLADLDPQWVHEASLEFLGSR